MAGSLPMLQPPSPAVPTSAPKPRLPSFSSSASISKFISAHPPLLNLETNCHSTRDLQILHAQIIKSGLGENPIALSRLLAFFAAHPSPNSAYPLRLFAQIKNPNPFSWNTIIRILSRSSDPSIALLLFLDMLLNSPGLPRNLTFPSLFAACGRLGSPQFGAQLHAMAAKLALLEDSYVANSMIFMYGSCGDLSAALALFGRRLPGGLDLVACNSMVMALARKGRIEDARRVFDEMPERTVYSWNTMMSGYLRNGRFDEVVCMFREMQLAGLGPNAGSIVSLLGACAGLGALEQGQWAHSFIIDHGIEMNPIILNALINMYCKCGRLDKALEVFESSPGPKKRALSSWNSMIGALGMHGHGDRALEFFSQMKSVLGLKPDSVSYIVVLTACAHSGQVDEAKELFAAMEEDGVEPTVEHYGCMVDVLARAGRLDEAEKMIKEMPLKPDVAIWGSLLSASRSYRDLEMAERAAAEVLVLDPEDAGGYIILANAHAASGEFGAAADMRMTMKETRAQHKPGCSMIEVDGMVHEFLAA